MIESLRSMGYSLETAIADIIDNSISANASYVKVNSEWRGGKSFIMISDDGHGMNREQLIRSMRPGAVNPLSDRSERDLGRFGLGLKTASFSQCRRLIVLSRRDGYMPVKMAWDLDYVAESGKWDLLEYCPEEFVHLLDKESHGTVVIWEKLDRLVPSDCPVEDEKTKKKFLESTDRMRAHLSMTFHRFIEDGFKVYCWDMPLEAWDPFMRANYATQSRPEHRLTGGGSVQGFILPHKDKLSTDEYKLAEGIKGWNEQQGFYVYRGKRLLIGGDWLNIGKPRKFRKEDHYKLARIMIDIPNSLDADWQIDIKKSTANVPFLCADELESYARKVREDAVKVFRNRGKIVKKPTASESIAYQPVWNEKSKNGKKFVVINRSHPLIEELRVFAKTNPKEAINHLLSLIEEELPAQTIYIHQAEDEESQPIPFDGNRNAVKEMAEIFVSNQRKKGESDVMIRLKMQNTPPFSSFPELIETII